MQPITIRRLHQAEEVDICAQMMAASEPWRTLQRDYTAAQQSIGDPTKEVYLACVGAQIAGFVVLNMHGAFVGYMQSVCVDTPWRGHGVGTALIHYAEQRILRETPNVFICVSSFNPAARKLYERLGYTLVGELPDFIVAGHAELLMRKTIAPIADFRSQRSHAEQE